MHFLYIYIYRLSFTYVYMYVEARRYAYILTENPSQALSGKQKNNVSTTTLTSGLVAKSFFFWFLVVFSVLD